MPHGSGYDWDGHIVGWAPGAPIEIDDSNEKAVAWARAWLGTGATLVEEVEAKPKAEPVKPAEPKKAAAISKP